MMRSLARTIVPASLLITVGFAAGFAYGQRTGFSTGGEWAMHQARIIADEEGLFMPVTYESGSFHVVIEQRRGLYREARRMAARQTGPSQDLLRIEEARPSEPASGLTRPVQIGMPSPGSSVWGGGAQREEPAVTAAVALQ